MIRLKVNGRDCEVEAKQYESLADVLRHRLNLTGVRVSCERGECGSCTVLLDGQPVPSCLLLAAQAEGKEIVTIEGLARQRKAGGAGTGAEDLHPVQQAFIDEHGMQCGFCTPGMILTTVAFLASNPDPTPAEVADSLSGHICRCGGYPRIVKSVLKAARYLREGDGHGQG